MRSRLIGEDTGSAAGMTVDWQAGMIGLCYVCGRYDKVKVCSLIVESTFVGLGHDG